MERLRLGIIKDAPTVLVCTLSTRCEGNRETLSCQAPLIAFTL
jgi:hypothetical protein